MSVQISYKKQILFGLFLLLIILSAIEVLFRSYEYVFPVCAFFGSDVFKELTHDTQRTICSDNIKLKSSNLPLRLEPNQHSKSININSDGFRGREIENNVEYRIFVIGGSTTFGTAATSDDQTIPAHLERDLKKTRPDSNFEVINAGIPGGWSKTELELVENKIIQYQPNLILIYTGFNDLNEISKNDLVEDTLFIHSILRTIIQGDYMTPKLLLHLYFDYNNAVHGKVEFDSSAMIEKVTTWKNNLDMICSMGKSKNYKTIIILQPLLGSGKKILSDEEKRLFIYYDSKDRSKYYELFANKLNELNANCELTLDLRNAFDSTNESIYFDNVHVGDNGNKIIASAIHERIISLILNDVSH